MERQDVPFNDIGFQWSEIEEEVMPDLLTLFRQGAFCLGPQVEKFEKEFADYIGVRHAIGVNSGTSALHLALIVAGVGPGDKVLLPAMTFVATAWAVLYVGAIPVLCDVEDETGNIDIKDAEKKIDSNVKAIIPVHLYGQPANMTAVQDLAKRHDLIVIEDAAQAHGAYYDQRRVGSFGMMGCFSFYPGKNLGAAGEAGMIVTNDSHLVERLCALRQHAQKQKYLHEEIGYNYRMEGIQGLILSHKLARLDHWTDQRKKIAQQYTAAFADLPLKLPLIKNNDHVYHLYVIRTPQRDALQKWLNQKGIVTGLHYPVPLHHQPCLKNFSMDRQSFPISDVYATEGISLPLFYGMTSQQVQKVIKAVREFFNDYV